MTLLYAGRMNDDDPDTDQAKKALETAQILMQLEALRAEHRNLNAEVDALHEMGTQDMLKLGRLKKRKLHLKDRIRVLEDQLTPDIIA